MSVEGDHEEAVTIRACAVARQIDDFDLLIEDMEAEFGEHWGGLTFENAPAILNSELAKELEFITVAVDTEDQKDLAPVAKVIRIAKENNVGVILVPHNIDTVSLHQLMRSGADDFAPYPLADGALHDAIARAKDKPEPVVAPVPVAPQMAPIGTTPRDGIVLPVYGLAGGVGASTFATNLAWELQLHLDKRKKKVCILDFDFQFGSVSTYLDIPRTEMAFEFLSYVGTADKGALHQAMTTYKDRLSVLPSAPDALPLEILEHEDISHLIELAKSLYDFVIIDVPQALVSWSEVVLDQANLYFGVIELDMRSAQNTLRFLRTLKAEDLPYEKVQFVLNRAPKFTDLSGKSRLKKLTESLEITIRYQLPDGGKHVVNAGDEGVALADIAPKNALRKEIVKIAKSLSELASDTEN